MRSSTRLRLRVTTSTATDSSDRSESDATGRRRPPAMNCSAREPDLNSCVTVDEEDSDCTDSESGVESKQNADYSPRFEASDRRSLVKMIYDQELVRYAANDGNDSDADNDDFVGGDKRPLLGSNSAKKMEANRKEAEAEAVDDGHSGLTDTDSEGTLSLSFQVFVPFLIAGFGTVGAGLVLDYVQHWKVFREVSEVFILVPALLGLKGNLEMTLASRLSTQANLGHLNTRREQWLIASGNITLIQCQATIVGFLAAVFAILMDWIPERQLSFRHALLLCASSLLTASVASFILAVIMIFVVILSQKCNINPDNIATPIAASLGDLTTLSILAYFSNILYYTIDTNIWFCSAIVVVFLMLIPVWCHISKNNKYTKEVLYNGWTPVISAMIISSIGGCILDFAVSRFKGIAVFQPVINGVGGNLVAVQSSRISTYLHQKSKLGILPKSDAKLCFTPCAAFFGSSIHSRTARILIALVIPGHLIFTYGIRLLQAGHTTVTLMFLVVYLTAALIQVFFLLWFAHSLILWMWRKSIDPDNSAIPYLTALGDLLGTALLAVAFLILFSIGDRDTDVGD